MSITFESFCFFQKDFDLQMEIEKEKYEKRLQETLEVILIMIYNWNYSGSCLNVTHQGTRDCTGCRNTQVFFREVFWNHNFLSDVTGCRKTLVSDC